MRPEEMKLYRTVADAPQALWDDVRARSIEDIVRSALVSYSPEKGFCVPYMGGEYWVNVEAKTICGPSNQREPGFQKALALLGYLAKAQDLGQAGRQVTARELNGGDMFFVGIHALATVPIINTFGEDGKGFLNKAAELGFAPTSLGSGFACQGHILPQVPMAMILHEGDEEFDADLTYTFDAYAHYHMALDAIWSMINVLADEFLP